MPRIQVLPPAIANKIAAGEVVERPASVVKELVENSIDAGASRIAVDIEEGGKNLIRIVDNGLGMEMEDLPLALASHATSKLSKPEDLFAIDTMGFRGEAIASIGSVSEMKIISRYRGEEAGAEIECRGGQIGEPRILGAPEGTTIEVRNLFYNVPVRRKFLKSTASETAAVSDSLTRMALAYPGIHFHLHSSDKEIFDCPPTDRRERITAFYGRDLADQLIEVNNQTQELKIDGYVALPAVNRANRSWQLLFLNGRYIQDRSISHAMNEAYRGLMPERRFPIIFLFLEMDPAQVDVNAHPTKIEVRFRSNWSLYGRVLNAVRNAVLADPKVATMDIEKQSNMFEAPKLASGRAGGPAPVPQTNLPWAPPRSVLPRASSPPSSEAAPATPGKPIRQGEPEKAPQPSLERKQPTPALPPPSTSPISGSGAPASSLRAISHLRVFQVHNSYIIQETEEGFIVIDQHALHERVLYCEMKEKLKDRGINSQQLLLPEPVDLTPKEMALVRELKSALAELGLRFDDFGRQAVVIQSVPAFLKKASAAQLLHDILSELAEGSAPLSLEKIQTRILATMACKAATKFGDPLTQDEMVSLVERSADLPETLACPHGRPTKLAVSLADLERQFGRK